MEDCFGADGLAFKLFLHFKLIIINKKYKSIYSAMQGTRFGGLGIGFDNARVRAAIRRIE